MTMRDHSLRVERCARNLITYASIGLLVACASEAEESQFERMPDLISAGAGGIGGSGMPSSVTGGGAGGSAVLPSGGSGTAPDAGVLAVDDPETCEEAVETASYVGCDYWPTVTRTPVFSIFDFAVVVSNPGDAPAEVTVSGGALTAPKTVIVMPGLLEKIYLPWVTELKGPDASNSITLEINTHLGSAPSESVLKAKGAYHLVSSVPVLVYQFSPIEYKGAGGPPGKDWSDCPISPATSDCFSYSNDASLLLPSTAMSGSYRVVTTRGRDFEPLYSPGNPAGQGGYQGFFTVTATADNTQVTVLISGTGEVVSGTGIDAMAANAVTTLIMNAGDVAQFMSARKSAVDLSGSLVQADKPIQIIGGAPCTSAFDDQNLHTCDHVEELVMPAETWGMEYVVTMPSGSEKMGPDAHVVRFIGNVDNTQLTYSDAIEGAPATLDAGEVVEVFRVGKDFVVSGDHAFSVSTLQLSGVDANIYGGYEENGDRQGDPSLSMVTAVEQYRRKYVFLAPDDYTVNFADVVAPAAATLTLDFMPLSVTPTPVGTTDYVVYRILLESGNAGGHTLESDMPVGLQVLGYGEYTSYQYPGGLNLRRIAPPPPPIAVE